MDIWSIFPVRNAKQMILLSEVSNTIRLVQNNCIVVMNAVQHLWNLMVLSACVTNQKILLERFTSIKRRGSRLEAKDPDLIRTEPTATAQRDFADALELCTYPKP